MLFFCLFLYNISMEKINSKFLDRMKIILSYDDYDLYLKSLNDDVFKGFTMSKSKFLNLKISIDDFLNNIDGKVLYETDKYYYIKSNIINGKSPFFHSGLIYIQEPSASYPLKDIKFKGNEKVLDMCASPGGKSVQFLYNLDKGGIAVLNEFDYKRAKILESNIERMGFINYIILNNNSDDLSKIYKNYFDIILIDAPCSGEGMFRKSDDARRQWSENLVYSCSEIQKKLLEDAYSMLKNNGTLIYSTCTFSKEEDELVVEYFLNNYKDMNIITQNKIFPFMNIGEGQYYAILKKDDKENHKDCDYLNEKIRNKQVDKKIIKECISNFLIDIDEYFDEDLYRFENINDNIYLVPNCINYNDNLNVITYGIRVLEKKKNRYEIAHHFSHFVNKSNVKNVIELDETNIEKYLRGESLYYNQDKSIDNCLITYRGLNIGLGKINRKMIKNHYPKGLRNF